MNRWLSGPRGLLVVGVAVLLSACGSAGSSTAGRPAADPSAAPAAPAGPHGASGTIAAVSAAGMEVQDPSTGQVTVTFTPSTSITTMVDASAGDLAAGDCVVAMGAPQAAADPGGPITARSVRISPAAADGTCAAGGPSGGARAGSRPSGTPSARNRPPGAGRGRAANASGKITSVTGGSFVVQGGGANAGRTVTTTPATTFSKTAGTDRSGLVVGQCVTAIGPSDDTGTVAASAISIRQPGPGGCSAGLGGFRRGTGHGGPGEGGTAPGQGDNHA